MRLFKIDFMVEMWLTQRTKRQDEQRREFMSHELIQIFEIAVILCSKWKMETRTAAYKLHIIITIIIIIM